MSKFNKNGKNLSEDQEQQWLEANATPVKEETKAEPKAEKPAKEAASTKEPDEGTKQTEEPKRRRGLRRNKKGEDNG